MICTVDQRFLDRLIAQPVTEQTARLRKIEQAMVMIEEAEIFVESGMLLHACAKTGRARELAMEAGLI